MSRSLILTIVVLLTTTCTRQSRFLERTANVGERQVRYRVWLPARYTKLHHWPVVLFLHGAAQRGDDNAAQLTAGLAPAVERFGQRYKCIVVFPQCARGAEWIGDSEEDALAALRDAIHEFHGDQRRVYLTGIDIGASGAWYMARHRRRFAAVIPIGGAVAHAEAFSSDPPPDVARIVGAPDPFTTLAKEIGDTPVWAFHGARDAVVPPSEGRRMYDALRANGGRATYTELPLAHECWDAVYASSDVVHWMMRQRR